MLEQAVSEKRFMPAKSFRSRQRALPRRELPSALCKSIALISHDLRLPLTAILANAEFLAQSKLSEIERNEIYQEIRSAVDQMNEMVSSLLDCSMEIETLRPAPRNIVKTVKQAISMTNVRPEFRRIAITHRHEGLATGWFDASRFGRAVLNLVLNACEAVSPHSGQIVITTTGTGAQLQLDVWDNGPGIPAAIQQSIFQPYVSYGKANGHGLGLAIAKKIVEDHGGEICFDASCKTGTLFKITIPFAVPHGTIARMPVADEFSNCMIVRAF